MTDKAYIVANEQQERDVLEKLEQDGLKWKASLKEPTQWLPTHHSIFGNSFPYVLFGDDVVSWSSISELKDGYEIVYDGRKEEYMSEKYIVSQEFMDKLEEWKLNTVDGVFISDDDIEDLPYIIVSWWVEEPSDEENNNRLIAILRWVNGEDVFEVKPKKWVVRSKERDSDGDYWYVEATNNLTYIVFYEQDATKFDTKEEAESWANAHQEIVEIEVDE